MVESKPLRAAPLYNTPAVPLRHDDEFPLLTSAQQAETLRLAARLQAEHEARSSSEALLQAAAEAGIDARFVREAAQRVVSGSEKTRRPLPRPLIAVALLTVLNWFALVNQRAEYAGIQLEVWQIVGLALAAFAASAWVGRERRVRWTMPLAVVAIWLALGLPDLIYHVSLEGRGLPWLPALIAIVGGLQFAGASLGAFLWGYEPRSRTGRLHRQGQP